jgi:hypothetical protein
MPSVSRSACWYVLAPLIRAGLPGSARPRGRCSSRPGAARGCVCVAWQQIPVGRHRAGRTVDIHVGPELLHIWDGSELLKTALRDNAKEVRKKRASVTS